MNGRGIRLVSHRLARFHSVCISRRGRCDADGRLLRNAPPSKEPRARLRIVSSCYAFRLLRLLVRRARYKYSTRRCDMSLSVGSYSVRSDNKSRFLALSLSRSLVLSFSRSLVLSLSRAGCRTESSETCFQVSRGSIWTCSRFARCSNVK